MQNKLLILLIVLISGFSQLALAEEINVTDADYVWNFTLNNNTNVTHINGEPGVMVVKYADSISYLQLEYPTSVGHLTDEPGVMVVKYADSVSYLQLENPTSVEHLTGESGVMVVKYADSISYLQLENPTSAVEHLIGEPGVIVVKYADSISYEPLNDPTSVSRRELEITIDNPSNGDLILEPTVTVNGTAFSPNEIISVTVNRILATGTTSWKATIPLTTGINTITVEVITNTSNSDSKSIQVFHYTEGDYTDSDGDGVIDRLDKDNSTTPGFLVNSEGIGRLFGDFNNNGILDSGDATLLMQMIVGLVT